MVPITPHSMHSQVPVVGKLMPSSGNRRPWKVPQDGQCQLKPRQLAQQAKALPDQWWRRSAMGPLLLEGLEDPQAPAVLQELGAMDTERFGQVLKAAGANVVPPQESQRFGRGRQWVTVL
jgi:hypothetical protein